MPPVPTNSQIQFEDLAQMLANHQGALFGYITFLAGRVDDVPEILQQTNLALLRKAAEFRPGSSFLAWARGIAYFEVLTFRRERGRDRHLFDDGLLAQLACVPQSEEEDSRRRVALRHCLTELPDKHRQMIAQRYAADWSIMELARHWRRSEAAMKMALLRLRKSLFRCVERRLGSS